MSSSRNLEEDQENSPENSPLGDEALQKANDYIKELFGILKQETNKVRKEKEAFDEMAKKLEHVHFSKMLKLNVGGLRFETSLETLTKDPGKLAFINAFWNIVRRTGAGLVERVLGVGVLLGVWDAYPIPDHVQLNFVNFSRLDVKNPPSFNNIYHYWNQLLY